MNKKGTSIMEALFIVAMFAFLVGPAVYFKQWGLAVLFSVFGVFLGLTEWWFKAKTGKTVSGHFWVLCKKNKKGAIIVLVCMGIAWILLLVHLGWKL